jgi:hypothetical protein
MYTAVVASHRHMGRQTVRRGDAKISTKSVILVSRMPFRRTWSERKEMRATGREDSCCPAYRATSSVGETP